MYNLIKNKLRGLIRGIIAEEFAASKGIIDLSKQAVFNKEKVRIDPEAKLANNRGDKGKIVIGDNTWIQGELMTFKHGGEIQIGEYVFIGPGTRICSAKKITIGNRVLISHNVNVYDNISHPLNSRERHKDFVHILTTGLQEDVDLRESEVVIGDDAWLGFNVTVLKGVRIGKGAIVGACSLVTEDVPDYAVVVGNPAKIVKYTD